MSFGRRFATVAVAVVTAAASCGGDDSAAAAKALRRQTAGKDLKIEGVPGDGHLAGNVIELKLSGAGVAIVEPDGDTSGKTAHYVIFVDRDPVAFGERIPEGEGVIETSESPVTLSGLTAGPHKSSVVLADGTHRRIGTKAVETAFTVSGPTLQASALDKSPAKQPVIVSIAVTDVGVAQPDGAAGGGTGHFDLFVDRDPTAAGQPVPTQRGIIHTSEQTVAVPDLGGGEHEIWVVLVKGDETPFEPMVADRVDIEVG